MVEGRCDSSSRQERNNIKYFCFVHLTVYVSLSLIGSFGIPGKIYLWCNMCIFCCKCYALPLVFCIRIMQFFVKLFLLYCFRQYLTNLKAILGWVIFGLLTNIGGRRKAPLLKPVRYIPQWWKLVQIYLS